MDEERQGLLGSSEGKNYSAIARQEKEVSPRRRRSPTKERKTSEKTLSVFCIHGSKWGVAQCCQELEGPHAAIILEKEAEENLSWKSEEDPHCHQSREGGVDKKAQRKLVLASVLCILFMIGEVVGGVLANSLAIATDAAHLLTDFASFMISLFAIWIAAKPNSHRMSFGWHRAEVLGATVSVLLIWVVTGILNFMAIQRVMSPDFEIDAVAMLITSGVGVAFNIVMGCTLHQHGHSHGGGGHGHSHGGEGHGHSHGEHDSEAGDIHDDEKEQENINVKAAFIHTVGDLLQSIGVFVAAIIIYFKPTWTLIDPICTFVFSILVLATTVKILKDTLNVLMEATPQGINYDRVQKMFLSVDGIQKVHSLRIWGLTTNKSALAAHLVISPGFSSQTVLHQATAVVRSKYKFYEMTLQVEEFQNTMDQCTQCKDPRE